MLENSSSNQLIYAQREVYGFDIYSVIQDFTKRVLISENVVKYEYGANVIGLTFLRPYSNLFNCGNEHLSLNY